MNKKKDAPAINSNVVNKVDYEYRQVLTIFEGIDEAIYVSDPKSYEILYANRAIEKDFGYVIGKRCYETFQGLKSPCPFCTNDIIFNENLGESYIWEFQNLKTRRWYRCIDRAIAWSEGRMVRCEMAIDITDRKTAEEKTRLYTGDLSFLWKTALDFVALPPNEDIFRFIGIQLKNITTNSLIIVSAYEPKNQCLVNHSIQAGDQEIRKVLSALGLELDLLQIPVNADLRRILTAGGLNSIKGGLFGFFQGAVPEHTCRKIELFLCTGNAYVMGLGRKDEVQGAAMIILHKGSELRNKSIIETFINQASICLQRKMAEDKLKMSFIQMQKTMEETVNALFLALEKRDPYTAGHERRVASLSQAIGTELGLSGEQIEGMRVTGFLHDIGKIVVPSEILSKPAKLTDNEYKLMKTHAQVGYDILKKLEFPWPVAMTVLQHHERLDGSGYPNGIGGGEITQESKIIAVADVVEAMSSHRPYRAALGLDKALEEIEQNSGVLYDPEVGQACRKIFQENKFRFE